MLAFQQCLTHQKEVFLEQLVSFVFWRKQVHASKQGGIYPSVATTPIAIIAIWFLVWWHIVCITPPESIICVEATATAFIPCPQIHL
jgi:hypothetical protein